MKLVLLALPGHAGNAYALHELRRWALAGHIAAILNYPEEVALLRDVDADEVFHVCDEARTDFADNALAGAGRKVAAVQP